MSKKSDLVDAYNKGASSLSRKFDIMGPRAKDIKETFDLVPGENPKTIEIGCGNGRDALEICKYTNDYLGIDISSEMIRLAKVKVPSARFEVADVEKYDFPFVPQVVFAFASLLHVDRVYLELILGTLRMRMRSGGLIRISLKYADSYTEEVEDGGFGRRVFYLYSEQDLMRIARGYRFPKIEVMRLRNKTWLEVLLERE